MSFKQKKQFTDRSDYWNTPTWLFESLIKEGWIDYNPSESFIEPFNKHTSMYKCQRIFINPPFSLLGKDEMYLTLKELLDNDNDVLMLIPSRTDTVYFHRFLEFNPDVTFIKGRLKYNDSKQSAPFPSLFLKFSNNKERRWFTYEQKRY